MSAPFFLGKIIDVIYTDPTVDSSHSLTHLCLVLSGVFLCGAAANAVRVYLMQTSGKTALILHERGLPEDSSVVTWGYRGSSFLGPEPCGPLSLPARSVGTEPHVQPVGAMNCFRSHTLFLTLRVHEAK